VQTVRTRGLLAQILETVT